MALWIIFGNPQRSTTVHTPGTNQKSSINADLHMPLRPIRLIAPLADFPLLASKICCSVDQRVQPSFLAPVPDTQQYFESILITPSYFFFNRTPGIAYHALRSISVKGTFTRVGQCCHKCTMVLLLRWRGHVFLNKFGGRTLNTSQLTN